MVSAGGMLTGGSREACRRRRLSNRALTACLRAPTRNGRRLHEDVMDDNALAAWLAGEAGNTLLEIQRSAPADEIGTRALKDRGDRESQFLLARLLKEHRPADAVLSEEAADDVSRLTADRVWIIDPLDGTREFSEGRDDWAVHVALWSDGDLIAGAVAHPAGRVPQPSDAARPGPGRRARRRAGAHGIGRLQGGRGRSW